ncbi:hypothetical protein [Bartonella schoenbuchensis]|uniref:hypothetical protein n=1 Tax=Bartonella schoenbuchensis TaxID=165694 RepID=UPI0031456892
MSGRDIREEDGGSGGESVWEGEDMERGGGEGMGCVGGYVWVERSAGCDVVWGGKLWTLCWVSVSEWEGY